MISPFVAGFAWGVLSGASVMFGLLYVKIIRPQVQAARMMDQLGQTLGDEEQMSAMMAPMRAMLENPHDQEDGS